MPDLVMPCFPSGTRAYHHRPKERDAALANLIYNGDDEPRPESDDDQVTEFRSSYNNNQPKYKMIRMCWPRHLGGITRNGRAQHYM